MVKVKKDFGTFPDEVVVLSTSITFDEEGLATVEDEAILAVLAQIPGYTVQEAEASEAVVSEPVQEAGASEVQTVKAPSTKRRAQPTKK